MDLLMRSAIKIGGQFSGVGAFDSALDRLGIKYDNIYQAELDKYARLTYLHNHKSPKYYVEDVNNTPIEEITEKYGSLDIAMFSPPCQSFSLAGKRLGKDDKRGILFFNSHEFITKNEPRYFIFENVKGLLSDDGGKTFSEWLHLLGGKSVNGMPIVFPYDGAVPYHVYWKVLNAKDFGVPQNRERVFIIGIRDDIDNDFSFPKEVPLTKRLKDVLESEVDEKYYLSDKMIDWVSKHREKRDSQNDFPLNMDGVSSCVTARYFKMGAEDPYIQETPTLKQVGSLSGGKWDKINESARRYYSEDGISPTIHTCGGGNTEPKIEVYENWVVGGLQEHQTPRTDGICPALTSAMGMGGGQIPIVSDKVVQLNNSKESGGKQPFQHNRVYSTEGVMTTLDTDSGRKSVLIPANNSKGYDIAEEEEDSINFSVPSSETRRGRVGHGVSQTLDTACNQGIATRQLTKQQLEKLENLQVDENVAGCITHAIGRAGSSDEYIASVKRNAMITQRIRRLTPKECFRLMDFPDTFDFSVVSNSQAYKQAGNSIVVAVLAAIINKLKL